jgi:hypothetical protein
MSTEWPLILKTGFGNVFENGRWDYDSTHLIADAINDGDWQYVQEYAELTPWDDALAH